MQQDSSLWAPWGPLVGHDLQVENLYYRELSATGHIDVTPTGCKILQLHFKVRWLVDQEVCRPTNTDCIKIYLSLNKM